MENQFPKPNGSTNLHDQMKQSYYPGFHFEVTLLSKFLLTALPSRLSSRSNPTIQVPSHNLTIQFLPLLFPDSSPQYCKTGTRSNTIGFTSLQ